MTAPAISIKLQAPLINKKYSSNQYLQIIILEQNRVTKFQQISEVSKLIKNKKNQIFFEKICCVSKNPGCLLCNLIYA